MITVTCLRAFLNLQYFVSDNKAAAKDEILLKELLSVGALPTISLTSPRIMFVRLATVDHSREDYRTKVNVLTQELLATSEVNQIRGIERIVDFTGFGLRNMMNFGVSAARTASTIIANISPVKHVRVHAVHMPLFVHALIKVSAGCKFCFVCVNFASFFLRPIYL